MKMAYHDRILQRQHNMGKGSKTSRDLIIPYARQFQDIGIDGLSSEEERQQFNSFESGKASIILRLQFH
jgi:hypothetical protein